MDSIYTLKPVIVSARGENSILNIPYAIDHIDSTYIQNEIKVLSLSEVLNQVPGLIVNDRNNPSTGDKISMRGIGSRASFGVRGIKIIYDGIPLTFADGQSELTNLDFTSMGSIEVQHGPASALYGNAAGGVINIKSEKPSTKSVFFNPFVSAGSFGYRNYSIKSSGTINKFSYLLSINKLLYNGFRNHSSANSTRLNSNLIYNFNEQFNIKAVINYFYSPYLLNPSSLTKDAALISPEFVRPYIIDQGAGEKVSDWNYGITLTSIFSDNFKNNTTLYFIRRSLLNPIPGKIIDLKRNAGGFRTFFEKKFQEINSQTDLNLKGGFDFEFQHDLRKEFINNGLKNPNIEAEDIFNKLQYGNLLLNQKENVIGFAPFITAGLNINKKIELQLTLRYDNYYFKAEDNLLTDGNNSGRRSMYNFSPAAGIILLPMPYIKLYANYAESFQTPTTNELSNNPSGGGGFNPTLEPEKIRSYEIGAWGILQSYKLNFEAALFVMKFNNMLISYQSQEIGEEEIFYKNAGRAENIGGELRLDWNPLKEIDLIVSYTKMNFTFKDYNVQFSNDNGDLEYKQLKGKYIPGIPEDYLSAGISYRSPMGLFLKLQTQWSGSYFTNDFNGPAPDFNSAEKNYINNAYLKTDLILGYKLKAAGYMIDFSGEVYNVFSKRYNASIVPNAAGERFFEPSPGRNLYFKIETEF